LAAAYYLDTNVLIALIEPTGPLTERQADFVAKLDHGEASAVASEVALAECLVKPLSDLNTKAIEAYHALFSKPSTLIAMPVTRNILISAATLRAVTRLRLPDAIHLATAQEAGCTAFVTNDPDFVSVAGMQIVRWSDLNPAP